MVLHRPVGLAGIIGKWPATHKNTGWNAWRGRPKINGVGDELNPWPIVVSAGVMTAAGIGTWGAVGPSSELFGPTVRHTTSTKTIALTFDDGPNPAVTPKLLELFERYSVRVTFFLIGKFARACPDLVREISAHGHSRQVRAVTSRHLRCHTFTPAAWHALPVWLSKRSTERRGSPRRYAS